MKVTSLVTHGITILQLIDGERVRAGDLAEIARRLDAAFYPKEEVKRAVSVAYNLALAAANYGGPTGDEIYKRAEREGGLDKVGPKVEVEMSTQKALGQQQLARLAGLNAELGLEFEPHSKIEDSSALALAWALIACWTGKYAHILRAQPYLNRSFHECRNGDLHWEAHFQCVKAKAQCRDENQSGVTSARDGALALPDKSPLRPLALNLIYQVTGLEADFTAAEEAAMELVDSSRVILSSPEINLSNQGILAFIELAGITKKREVFPSLSNTGLIGRIDCLIILKKLLSVSPPEDIAPIYRELYRVTGHAPYAETCIECARGCSEFAFTENVLELFRLGFKRFNPDTLLKELERALSISGVLPHVKCGLLLTAIEGNLVTLKPAAGWRRAFEFAEASEEPGEKFAVFCRLARVASKMPEVSVF